MSSKKPTIILIATLVLAAAISFWGIFFNQATIIVTTELTPFKIDLGQEIIDCPESPCTIKVTPRRYEISIAKAGYSEQNQEATLRRGDKLEINYAGFILPRIKPLESADPIPQGYLKLNNSGVQTLYIRTPDQGDIVVTTFKDPLDQPNLRIAPERDYALVWDATVYPPEYFHVDIPLKTKKTYQFPSDNFPDDIKFLDSQNILLLSDNQVRLFNLESGQSDFFPIQSLDQIQPITNTQALIISTQDLDQFNPTADQNISFEDILSVSEDNVNINSNQNQPLKLYYYIDGAYTLLFQLQEELTPPYSFFETQIENQTEIILQSNDNLHLIKTEL